jgi:predicted DNA-binding protein (MmcQ/YjbR family)
MNIEELRDYALSKTAVEESLPFGPQTLVFKVAGKIFLLVSLDAEPLQFNAKCDPEKALEWREHYNNILPGYHMNKKHWNTVIINGTLTNKQLKELVDHSYGLVAPKTKKNKQL